MKSFSILLVLFITCNFDKIEARSVVSKIDKWLNTKIEDVNEQCESNGKTKFDGNVLHKYYNEIQDYMVGDAVKDMSPEDYFFNVTYNPNMIQFLKKIIKNIQDCLDEENRLSPVELAKVMNKILTMHANRVLKIAPTIEKDVAKCQHTLNSEVEKCADRYMHLIGAGSSSKTKQTILQSLIPTYVNSSSCTEVLPLEQCYMKHMHHCNSNAKTFFQIIFTPSEITEGICENFFQNSDLDSDDVTNDIFHQDNDNDNDEDETNDSLKRLFHL